MSGLSERESGTAKLEEAVAAYREALKEWTREAAPTQHASVQEKLAACLGFVRTAAWALAAGRPVRGAAKPPSPRRCYAPAILPASYR